MNTINVTPSSNAKHTLIAAPSQVVLINEHGKQDDKKLTVGFRCHPDLKRKLVQKAGEAGITLSEYLELRLNREDNLPNKADPKKFEAINEQLSRLQKKITMYENATLIKYYEKMKDMSFDFQDSNGNDKSIRVTSPKDVFELMLASFKIDL